MSEAWNTLRAQTEHFPQPFPEAAIAFADARREAAAHAPLKGLMADPAAARNSRSATVPEMPC
ncbi:MAG: hypothetical protein WCI19_04675 [Betaproteobacteria bacterium]|jgi:hypothetical protein|nr:hypothetical protein [Rhodocyclales bacterium]